MPGRSMSSGDYLTGESRQFALAANKDQSRAELTSDLGDSHLLGAKLLGQSRAIEPKLRGAYASRASRVWCSASA
jgi:hypothetical protein